MTTHLGIMILFAACVSAVFGALLRDEAREQVRLALRLLAALAVGGYALGWVMYFLL